jgi:hypothetical protein
MPRYITKLSPACFLRLDSNPLQEPPWEIAKKGIEAIARYFEQPSAIIFDSNKAIKIRNGVPTQEDASEVNPEPYSNHDFVTDTAVVGLLHSSVTRINLGGCHLVTDETIHAIARNCKSLKSINVSTCHKVTDGGLVDLAKSFRHLQWINFRGTIKFSKLPDKIGNQILNVSGNNIRKLLRSIVNLPPNGLLRLEG